MTTVGSLCSGYGGLDIAVSEHYDAEIVWHAENAPDPAAVLEARWPDVPNLGDLTAVDWSTVPGVDIITAGYPCQPFSTAGRRKGIEDERHLWPYIEHAISVLRPRLVILENVRGHLWLGGTEVIGGLARLGLDARWGVVRAWDAGAPHQRARLFIVAAYPDSDGRPMPSRAERRQPDPRGCAADRRDVARLQRGTAGAAADSTSESRYQAWGQRAGSFARWERVIGRAAPDTLVDGELSAVFYEWMMGLPAGWVTDVLSNEQALPVLGNGVVPQQAALALDLLYP